MMKNLLPDLLPRLESHRLGGVNAGPDALYPDYDRFSLVNLAPSISRWLGAPGFAGGRELGGEMTTHLRAEYRHVILLVVDGLGLNTFLEVLEGSRKDGDLAVWGEMAESAVLAPLTSIAPSTTAAALTTFWTGCAPAEHGVFAYEVWLKEYGMITNMILHSPASFIGEIGSLRKAGFDPERFLPVPTLGPFLSKHGARVFAHQHVNIARSGLSTMLMPGAEILPFRSLSDLWVSLQATLTANRDERTYSYIYWGDLDEHSHRFGPDDERVALELAAFSRQLHYFIRALGTRSRQDILLLITADHGHIATPPQPAYELRHHPNLLQCLVMVPSGEARLPVAYLRPGREEQFLEYIQTAWPGKFLAQPSEEVVRAGLFGTGSLYPQFSDRVGDYVIFPQDDAYWWFGFRDNLLRGRHGGLSRTEMLVPLFAVEL